MCRIKVTFGKDNPIIPETIEVETDTSSNDALNTWKTLHFHLMVDEPYSEKKAS